MSIASNLRDVRGRIEAACGRAGRSPKEVTLIAVSKGFSADEVVEAYEAGQRDFGENRVQEAVAKIDALAARGLVVRGIEPRWHLIGHLQSNKAKLAASRFAIVHSVDSLRLAQELSRHAHRLPVLLEVNAAQEASKFGFAPEEVAPALSSIMSVPHIEVRGLMTVAPLGGDPEAVRPVFRTLRELRDSLELDELSMGMTNDYEVAIEEGATMVRVGRAIFGGRSA
jgi:pyridoxal phosphate enzyme (YggS family)